MKIEIALLAPKKEQIEISGLANWDCRQFFHLSASDLSSRWRDLEKGGNEKSLPVSYQKIKKMKIEEKYACLILESEDETLFANHPF